jgi:iron complex outermembrane recepter protein
LSLVPFLCRAQSVEPLHETVTVTGTYEPLSLEEIDRSLSVLETRERTTVLNTLADLLRLDPALDLRQRAPGGIQGDLSIRGSSAGQTLVLINGQRVNDPQTAHYNLDVPLALESVDRIEVLRGSGSTLYGSDAMGGVVNIITAPPEASEVKVRAALGNYGIHQESISLATAFRGLAEQVNVARDFSTGFMDDRDYRNLQVNSLTQFRSSLGTTDLTAGWMDHPYGANQFYGNYNSWEDTKTWFTGLRQTLGKNTEAAFSWRRHSDLFYLYRDRPAAYANHHVSEQWQVSLRRSAELGRASTLHYGAEGLRESVDSTNLGVHARDRGAVYVAADFRALKRFSLSLSAREELLRRWQAQFSPTVAAGAWLSPQLKLRASVSRAFRVPGYTDLYYHDPGNQGNPNLRPESAWNYEGGLTWHPAGAARAVADLTLFERRERNVIDYYRAAAGAVWQALNIQNLNFTGLEAGVRLEPRRGQTIDVRYAALRGRQDTVALGFTKYGFSYPRQSAVVSWQGTLARTLLVRSRLGVMSRFSSSAYAVWDLYAASARGRFRPFLQLTNLNAAAYQDIPGVAMPGRTILGGVEWTIVGR